MQPIYSTIAACAVGTTAWAIKSIVNLPNACEPIRSMYDNCHKVALQQLGEGVDLFVVTSWANGNSGGVSQMCSLEKGNYSDCMNMAPYIATAVVCSAIVLFTVFKLTKH